MSIGGRYVIDCMKRSLGRYLAFPVPPYGSPFFWEDAYRRLDINNNIQEWGQISYENIQQYEYTVYPIPTSIVPTVKNNKNKNIDVTISNNNDEKKIVTTLKETLGIDDNIEQLSGAAQNTNSTNPILIVGCGNSKFGEDLIDSNSINNTIYPLIQMDVSESIIDGMKYRCQQYIENKTMTFVLDDATEIQTLYDNKIYAAIDKGLADALYCANEYEQCYNMMYSIHRTLQHNGTLCIFSFSRPEFILPKLISRTMRNSLPGSTNSYYNNQHIQYDPYQQEKALRSMWHSVEVRKMNCGIFLYRFQKASTYNNSNTNGQQQQSISINNKSKSKR